MPAALFAATLLTPGASWAAGFALYEAGALGMGFAGAFTAQASDPSAIFHNAAGIGFLKRNQIYLGSGFVAPFADFTGDDPYPGAGRRESQYRGIIALPTGYYTHQFSERTVLGVGVFVPFGLETRWDAGDYSGRFISQRAKLHSYSVNPTVAYRLAERLSVGAGLEVRFANLSLRRRIPLVDPFTQRVVDVAGVSLESDTNTGIGFNLGVLAKPNESLSIGIAYRHKMTIDFTGNADFEQVPTGNQELDARVGATIPFGTEPVTTSIAFPAIASVGGAYEWGDWKGELDINWYQWSTFKNLTLQFPESPQLDQVIEENYDNSFQLRLGVERRLNDVWRVRGGYFFDKSPGPVESVSPILPDASRHGIALGGTWTNGALHVDGALWGVLGNSRSTEGRNRDGYEGTYSTDAITFAVFLGYSF
jgi:long-chain fatty acid transport protein